MSDVVSIAIVIMWGFLWAGFGFGVGYNFNKIRSARKAKELEEAYKPENLEPKKVPEHTEVIAGKRYSTLDSKVIAEGPHMFGYVWLLRTTHDNFFVLLLTVFGVLSVSPKTQEEAIHYFTAAPLRGVKFEDAFPDVKITDA